jgi:hypothetical protein
MSQQKAAALVVVQGGVAYGYAPEHVDLQIVDMDNLNERDAPKTVLPSGAGFEELVSDAGITDQVEFE